MAATKKWRELYNQLPPEARAEVEQRVLATLMSDYPETVAEACEQAHELSSYHREALEAAGEARCFYCFASILFSDIRHWVDAGQTAICPKCGIDALLPGTHSNAFLTVMYHYWFVQTTDLGE